MLHEPASSVASLEEVDAMLKLSKVAVTDVWMLAEGLRCIAGEVAGLWECGVSIQQEMDSYAQDEREWEEEMRRVLRSEIEARAQLDAACARGEEMRAELVRLKESESEARDDIARLLNGEKDIDDELRAMRETVSVLERNLEAAQQRQRRAREDADAAVSVCVCACAKMHVYVYIYIRLRLSGKAN
jgi:hypothetical protein